MPATVTVTGVRFADASGNPESGYVAFKPSVRLTDASGNVVQSTAPVFAPVSGGVMVPQALIPTDSTAVVQTGWVWQAQEVVSDLGEGQASRAYSFSLPTALGPSVDLQALRPVGSPAAVITATPMTVTGTPTTGQVITATGPESANWQTPSGGGGGGAVSSVFARTGAIVAQTGDYTASQVTGALQSSNNLSDVASASSARTSLGLGTAATQAATAFDASGAAASAQSAAQSFATSAVATETSRAQAAEALLAPLASPSLTGTPTAPTKTAQTNSTALATTAYTDSAVGVETTRAEAAEALKAPLASPALTGSPTAPTQTTGDNSTKIATDAFVTTAVAAETTRAEAAEAKLTTQVVVGAPTGTYATDVATINAAITAAGTYGTIYFPYSATAYNVDGLAPLTGQTWYGNATLQRPSTSTASIITATGISNFTLRGLTIDGNSVGGSTATSNAAIYLINTTWTLVENVTVQNCPSTNAAIILRGAVRALVDACQITNVGYGVLIGLNHGDAYSCYGNAIRGCLIDTTTMDAIFLSENLGSTGSVSVIGSVIGTSVTGCTVRNYGDCGIEVGSGTLHTQVAGCTFAGISNANGNNGILFRDAAHASATGCTVSNLTKTGSTGVYCVNLNGTCSFIDITDVNVYNVGYGIIAVGGTSPTSLGTAANNIAVTGGTINVTTADGIQMTNVAGFSITGTQVIAAGNQGISVGKYNTAGSGSTDGAITGCRVMNSSQAAAGSYSGIVLFQASADVAITNCRIGDNQGSKTQGYGIRVYDTTVTNVKISNCDVTNGGTVGNFLTAAAVSAGIEIYACTGISAVGLRTAVTRPDASWDAPDHGLIAWTYDAAFAGTSSGAPVGGVLYLVGVQARYSFTTTKAYLSWVNGGATPTANENWLGLYNSAGALVASAEIDSILGNGTTGAGLQTVSWSASYTGSPGQYWIGMLFNMTTLPTLYRQGSPTGGSTINAGITTAANYRFCMAGTSQTSLSSITPSSNSLSVGDTPRAWWAAIG